MKNSADIPFVLPKDIKRYLIDRAEVHGCSLMLEITLILLRHHKPEGWKALEADLKKHSSGPQGSRHKPTTEGKSEKVRLVVPKILREKIEADAKKRFHSMRAEILCTLTHDPGARIYLSGQRI